MPFFYCNFWGWGDKLHSSVLADEVSAGIVIGLCLCLKLRDGHKLVVVFACTLFSTLAKNPLLFCFVFLYIGNLFLLPNPSCIHSGSCFSLSSH